MQDWIMQDRQSSHLSQLKESLQLLASFVKHGSGGNSKRNYTPIDHCQLLKCLTDSYNSDCEMQRVTNPRHPNPELRNPGKAGNFKS